MPKVIVIGGGPAGMMAAITAAENGNEVTIIEKMPSFGRKLLITGKGRCNITSSLYMSEFIKNTPGNGRFLYSAFQNYTNTDIIDFLKRQGLDVKEERGKRYAYELVYELSKKCLDEGAKYCVLYADAENPISNHVYEKIGYVKRVECEELEFYE